MDHILRSDHQVINGIFMAIAYHVDLSVHNMVYDDERKVILTKMGPFVRSIREYRPYDETVLRTYGNDVFTALEEFAKAKEKV